MVSDDLRRLVLVGLFVLDSAAVETIATTTGCVFTSTTEAATLVYATEAFQLQKWNASIAPAPTAISSSRGVSLLHCRHCPVTASAIAMRMSEKPSRQVAMASGCACDRRTRGPENETPRIESARTKGARLCARCRYRLRATMMATVLAMICATVPVSAM